MTLTEEQREAIKYAISSLEQCGSEPEDPVVAKILRAMIDSSEDADYESLRCENCGKTLKEIRGSKYAGDYRLGEIRIDPGQEASISDPPIEPSYYFWCDECKNDSSDQFSEVTKLIPGFDLERVKADLGDIGDPRFCDCEVRTQLAAAIDEIERLRASLTDLHAEYINTLEKNLGCSAWDLDEQSIEDQRRLRRNAAHAISIVEPPIYLQADQQATKILELEAISRRRNEIINKQVAKIKELKADLEQSEICIQARLDVIDQQAALTKSLKKEIRRLKHESKVEQELTNSYIKRLHDAEARIEELEEAHKRSGAKYAKIINELRSSVYANIPGLDVGKIGPDAEPRVWQITEERVGLLEYCLETLLDAPDIEEIPGPGHSIEVLRAMLKEAGL